MAMKTRNDLMPFKTGINSQLLSKASKTVSNATGFPVQFNKAIVGKNAFAHESGIHQDGIIKSCKAVLVYPKPVCYLIQIQIKHSLYISKHYKHLYIHLLYL